MKKLLLAFTLLLLPSAALAQKTKAALTTEVNVNLASSSGITAATLRVTILDIINSYYDLNGLTAVSCGSNAFVTSFPTLSSVTCTQPTLANISGFGAGVATALGINVGTAGAFAVNGGALGTPSSGVGTNITGVNAATLGAATFAAPGAIGSGTAGTGAFTALSASSTVSGTGFTTYLASPPAIGGTAPGAGSFAALSATGLFNISGAAAGQIQFPATQNASANANTLDDYREGTFTPVLSFGGASVGITYSTQSGVFTKIGNVVNYALIITLTSKGTSTGNMSIGGLPISSNSFGGFAGAVQVNNLASSAITQVQAIVATSSTTLSLSRYAAGANVATADTDYTNTSIIRVTGIYFSN